MYRCLTAEVMIVVQNQNHLLLDAFQNLIQEYVGCSFRLLREFLRLLQERKHRLTKAGDSLLNSVSQITEENSRVGIRVIQLIPDISPFLLPQKIAHQTCFS